MTESNDQYIARVCYPEMARTCDRHVIEKEQLCAILTKIVNEWDQYFDAEGPLPDGGYRWSSITAADAIEEAKRLLKGAKEEL